MTARVYRDLIEEAPQRALVPLLLQMSGDLLELRTLLRQILAEATAEAARFAEERNALLTQIRALSAAPHETSERTNQ
jgi:hypothetical protein